MGDPIFFEGKWAISISFSIRYLTTSLIDGVLFPESGKSETTMVYNDYRHMTSPNYNNEE